MGLRAPTFFAQGVNMYVPKMQSSSELLYNAPSPFSLGSPAAVSANNVATAVVANAVATTRENYSVVLDGTYGRTLRLTPSGNPGNSASVDVFGEDYLGQPMAERFTGASGATAILYGLKAFKRVLYTKVVTAASNAVTWAIGTGWRLGLPYKGDIGWAKEGGVLVPLYKRPFIVWQSLSDADVTAGSGVLLASPCPGHVKTLYGVGGTGSTTDAAATVLLGTGAGTAITGLTVTADQDTAAVASDVPTTEGYSANNRLRTNDIIRITQAAAASGGTTSYGLEIQPSQFTMPVLTDPQTLTTGDPRGTYEPLMTPDGSEIIVSMGGDPSYNTSGNGGLHGIRHVIA